MSEPTMSPMEELRAAAQRIREVAAQAPPGPYDAVWAFNSMEIVPRSAAPELSATEAHIARVTTGQPHTSRRALGEWMALASPVLAEPLAALLEHAAARIEAHMDRNDVAVVARWAETAEAPALAVARVINGDGGQE